MGNGQEQQQVPQATAPMPMPGSAQTPLSPDIKQKQEDLIRQQQKEAAPVSHLPAPMPNPKYGAQGAKGALRSMIPLVGEGLQQSVQAKKQAEVDKYTMVFQQLDSEWVKAQQLAGGDEKKAQELYKQSPTYQSIFNAHDPKAFKTLKEMQQIFIAPWLDDGGEQSPAVAGFKRHQQLKSAEEQAKFVQQMQHQFQQSVQAQPSTVDPKQMQSLNQSVTATTGIARAEVQQKRETRLEETGHYAFQPDGKGGMIALNRNDPSDSKPVMIDYHDGKGPVPMSAKATGKNGTLTINGVPAGVYKNGQPVRPGDPGWTGEDARHLAQDQASWQTGEQSKEHRATVAAAVRATLFNNAAPVQVFDPDTNSYQTITRTQLQGAPAGKYAPPTAAIQMNNRRAIFNEIDATTKQLNEAIDEMGDSTFSAGTRAKIALALRDPDPQSAIDAFVHSEVADSLTDSQVKYVTALASMKESGMSLRTVGGMGQGSDKLRGAIDAMLPSAGIPSGAYARRQMQLFGVELNGLKASQGNLGAPRSQGGQSGGVNLDDTLNKLFPTGK